MMEGDHKASASRQESNVHSKQSRGGDPKMSVYEYQATNPSGQEVSLDQYSGKVLIIANTASQCGLTPQYGELQQLYDQYG